MAERLDTLPAVTIENKYRELSRKYAALVERLERKTEDRTAIYRLGFLGLRASGAGLSMVRRGRVTLANAPWHQLARGVSRTPLAIGVGSDARSYHDLRSLALGESDRLLADQAVSATVRISAGERTLEARFEKLAAGAAGPVAILVQDVTERAHVERELQRTREALFQQERLRLLGLLASSVAHDLGNTMRGMNLLVGAMRRRASARKLPDPALSTLENMVKVASDTLRRLSEFARSGRMVRGPVDLRLLISDACETVRVYLVGTGVPMHIECDVPGLPLVRGTIAELSHLLVNLLLNALEAMPEGGHVQVTARRTDGAVVVLIEDEGEGVPADKASRLFEPFFTTKQSGMGLGLWLAEGTMKALGGRISFAHRKGGGAAFTLEFPIAARPFAASAPSQAAPRRHRGAARVARAAAPRAKGRPALRR